MLKQFASTIFAAFFLATMSTLSLGVSAAAISNAVSENGIVIDADISDWRDVASLGDDAKTLADDNTQADYLEGWLAHVNHAPSKS